MNTHVSKELLESGSEFSPQFDQNGLIPVMVAKAGDNTPLMFAYMNKEALSLTLSTGELHFYSRSRKEIWHKGATSGNTLSLHEMRVDCDQDVLWVAAAVAGHGAACHTGQESCFYRSVQTNGDETKLQHTGEKPLFDPAVVYEK